MNGNNKIIIKENRRGEITKFVADISKAKNRINFEPKNSIKQGIRKTVKWYEENSKEG